MFLFGLQDDLQPVASETNWESVTSPVLVNNVLIFIFILFFLKEEEVTGTQLRTTARRSIGFKHSTKQLYNLFYFGLVHYEN